MRLAILSDIHGNLPALEAVVADFRHRGVDQVVNLGDSLSGPLLPRDTAHYLMESGWISLAGNHERQLLTLPASKRGASDDYAHGQLTQKEFEWLRTLRPWHRLSADVFLCHGSPRSDVEYFLETAEPTGMRPATAAEILERRAEERAPVIACGHTHVPRAVRIADGPLIVNPGSVGLPAYDDAHPYPHKVETGSPDARYAIIEKSAAGWSVCHCCVPYDFRPMAALARRNGRPDWEVALATGYLHSS